MSHRDLPVAVRNLNLDLVAPKRQISGERDGFHARQASNSIADGIIELFHSRAEYIIWPAVW
ncbi:MAG: hypothetical protein DMG13_34840 [Acidobacteria bacterium]|nr:MAG: hypothetical protein DMG13_34840 [Acidobacteriota bacterium]